MTNEEISLRTQVRNLTQAKDDAYAERDRLVAALSKLFPSHLTQHTPNPDPDWDKDWMTVVCIHLPTGQVTWHIHKNEISWFDHLLRVGLVCEGYDGYSTNEKYRRLWSLPVMWRPFLPQDTD